MVKKLIAALLSVCMLFSLCACVSDNEDEKSKNLETKADNISDDFASDEEEASEDNNFAEERTEAATITENLASSCSKVLATGGNNNDVYVLVANQFDGYPDSTFEFGVIKNNEWFVPMGSESPFITENGWWLGAEGTNEPGDFEYVGSGCFYYECNNEKVIYKPETNVSFAVWQVTTHPNSKYPNTTYNINANSEAMVRFFDPYNENKHPLVYVNMDTGETKALPYGGSKLNKVGPFGDGLFFADIDGGAWNEENDKLGFFDLNGNMVIDLSVYNIVNFKNYRFSDGQYTFTAVNNSNVRFDITIDTTGNIISQEKV